MPMWMHPPPPPPPPPPRRAPRASELSDRLADAIVARDMDAARKVFDTAFWEKVEFKPDGFHLLEAVRRGDRPMVSLLTSYGASWSEDETKTARRMTNDAEWKSVEGPLKNAGIPVSFSAFEQYPKDRMPKLRWLLRERLDATRRLDKNSDSIARRLEDAVSDALLEAVRVRDMDKVRDVLPYRNQKYGIGTKGDPLDLRREFSAVMDRDILGNGRQALAMLDFFAKEGYALTPITVSSIDIIRARDIVLQLDKRGLLNRDSGEARREVLDDWTSHRQRIDYGGLVYDMGEAKYQEQDAAFREAARIFFTHRAATPQEADYYIRLHARRADDMPEALANAEKQLLELGFFDSPSFTPAHMRQLGEKSSIKDMFNARAAASEIRALGVNKFLNPKKFAVIEEAHQQGVFRANAHEVIKILDYLRGEVKKDVVPEHVTRAVTALVKGKADFSLVNPTDYLGKHAPGLGKTLLDADAIPALKFIDSGMDLSRMRLLTPASDREYAYAEFCCQIMLEAADASRFKSLRTSGESYQKQFIRAWVQARAAKARRDAADANLRKSPPKPPGNAPRP